MGKISSVRTEDVKDLIISSSQIAKIRLEVDEQTTKNVTICRRSKHWFVGFKTTYTPPKVEGIENKPVVGVDLGIKTLVTLSNGKVFENKKPYKKLKRTLKIAQRKVSKKYVKGASAILDSKFYEFKRQIAYKTGWYGSTLTVADRFYLSSKTCSGCEAGRKQQTTQQCIDLCKFFVTVIFFRRLPPRGVKPSSLLQKR